MKTKSIIRRALAGVLVSAISWGILTSPVALAAPGDLDTSYGTNGRTISRFRTLLTDETLRDAVMQPDGKIVSVGECANSSGIKRFCIMRHTANGALDPTFGDAQSGATEVLIAGTNFSTGDSFATGVGLQRSGAIVVAGYCGISVETDTSQSYDVCLIRLLSNGKLDGSFGSFGVQRFETIINEIVTTLSIDSDDLIYVGGGIGFSSTMRGFQRRIDKNGKTIEQFAVFENGSVPSRVEHIGQNIRNFRYLTMSAADASYYWFNSAGQFLPNSFSDFNPVNFGGNVIYSPQYAVSYSNPFVIATVGGCLVPSPPSSARMCATRQWDNALDTSFGTAGKVLLGAASTGPDFAYSAVIQPDGKVILAGDCTNASATRLCMARLNQDGRPDLTFGNTSNGFAIDNSISGSARRVFQRPDGKLVLAGTCVDTQGRKSFCLSRYEGGPTPGRYCSLDVDGDGQVFATTDMLIANRVAAGMSGAQVLNGINLSGKPRNTWSAIREYLIGQCGMVIAQ
ncbi:MAG: hypothetical protein ACRCWJ_13475 [Casimicrobium sp.]